ncbi:hypothetical protein CEUSTIGMA_g13578.t1 [Chlamydomonas eustigma]|uniref:Uncharacterized protein n=1 Tax=Chlamydomonas eustigma TaxID=1157962 RepID=A0A250XSX9_9CHLO|nr:hypothetical protein CEUSTIGMA_g13578.t1 [Chlamydomonas eustigma]|eukprot:GAX86165.1 hypothetical protein CEUSTIGMA_g13578.t1 [Chlamydomonas eustigma]
MRPFDGIKQGPSSSSGFEAGSKANVQYMGIPELRQKVNTLAKTLGEERVGHQRARQRILDKGEALAKVKDLLKEMKKKKKDCNALATLVVQASNEGLLDEYGALQAFLVDVFKAMVFGRRSRQMSTPTKEFYSIIMQNCGQMLHDFVSEMFCGPSSSSTRAFKAAVDYPFMLGLHQDYFKMAATIIKVWKLSDAPFLLSEDGSALQMRIDIAAVKGRPHVFGLCGNSFVVDTVQQFRDAARDLPVATTLYAYTLVPLIEGAPCIPLFAFGHDNSSSTFSTGLAKEIWKYIC